jgi:hypothetical protein
VLKLLIGVSRFRRSLAPRIDRWIQDGVFHLQRRAYEGNYGVAWKLLTSEIPITCSQDLLPELPLETRCPKCFGPDEIPGPDDDGIELEPGPSQTTENITARGMEDEPEDGHTVELGVVHATA